MKTAAAMVLVAAVTAGASPAMAEVAHTSVAPRTPGSIDSDIRTAGGTLIGYLHGDLTKKGKGLGTFRPLAAERLNSLIVGLRARRAGTKTIVIAHGGKLHMRLVVTPNHKITGTGALAGTAVTLSGAAGEELPPLKQGMKMLVVGRPSGEGYRALATFFKPVRYDPRKHTRHNFLRERREFHSYAALVFGNGIAPHGIETHKLLRAFYGASKWVIVAPATASAQDALTDVHPYVPGTPSPLLAVRATGPAGSAQNVKPTLLYPTPIKARASRSVLTAAANLRKRWFLGELRRLSGAHMAMAKVSQGGDPVSFHVPVGSAAIELLVPYYHEFAFSQTQNKTQYQPCGWNQSTYNAWCTDTWFWKQQSGGDLTVGCQWFLKNGYDILDRGSVSSATTTQTNDGAYHVTWDDFGGGFEQESGDDPATDCPANGTQLGNIQGNDYYFALYDNVLDQHTLVVLTDPTVSASTNGHLWHEPGALNGSGETHVVDLYGIEHDIPRPLPETAWFLGQYTHNFTLTGNPPLSDQSFEYSSSKSFPNNSISFSNSSASHGTSQGFNVGIFGAQGTGGYTSTDSITTSVSVTTPDWTVSPTPGGRTISYSWQTNTPIDWNTIAGGGGGTWDLNDLNRADFSPAALTVWSGKASCCDVNISSTRGLWFVDHYSRWDDASQQVQDRFATSLLQYGDSPNEILVNTKNPVGPGIDLCDPAVMAPSFQDQCAGEAPPPTLSMVISCATAPASSTAYTVSLNGSPIGGPLPNQTFLGAGGAPTKTFTCPRKLPSSISPVQLKPGVDATLTEQVPSGLGMDTVIGCFKGDELQAFVTSAVYKGASVPKITIPGKDIPRGGPSISCMIVNKPPG